MPDMAQLIVEVSPKGIKEAQKQLDDLAKQSGVTEKSTTSLMDKFRNIQTLMQGPVAAFQAVTSVMGQMYAVGKDLVDSYAEQERAVSNLEAVLKATGGTVGRTSQELQDMAESFQKITLFDGDAITQMNAVLLGFRSIQGDTFERTTEAILDMSTVMGTDLVSSANMLGKALDSPTQGMSALSRVGFVWTDQQREIVKAMEESGDLLGAQKVILGEVEKAFGGAARAAGDTATGAFNKLGDAVGDAKESLGALISITTAPMVNYFNTIITGWNKSLEAMVKYQKAKASGDEEYARLLKAQMVARSELETARSQMSSGSGLLGSSSQIMEQRIATLAAQYERLTTAVVTYEHATGIRKEYVPTSLIQPATGGTTPPAGPSQDELNTERLNALYGQTDIARREAIQAQIDWLQSLSYSHEENARKAEIVIEALQKQLEVVEKTEKIQAGYGPTAHNQTRREIEDASMVALNYAENLGLLNEETEDAVIQATAYDIALENIRQAMVETLQSGSIDALKDLGEAWASGANAGDSFAQSIADIGLSILNQLPLLLLQAGVSVIGSNPAAGLALIAASGLVAIGAGAANSAASGGGSGTITANALGGVYSSPSLSAYSGGVYTSPQMFAFAKGGVFAEAGPEAIMPLSRGSDGKLGVKSSGGGVNVIVNNYSQDSTVSQREETGPNGEKQIVVTVENIIKQAMANGRMDGVMSRFGIRPHGVRV